MKLPDTVYKFKKWIAGFWITKEKSLCWGKKKYTADVWETFYFDKKKSGVQRPLFLTKLSLG